jgi:hypothetical protein
MFSKFCFQESSNKLQGNWISDTYQAYLSLTLKTCTPVADIMAANIFENNTEQNSILAKLNLQGYYLGKP